MRHIVPALLGVAFVAFYGCSPHALMGRTDVPLWSRAMKTIVIEVRGGIVQDVALIEGEADGSVRVLVRDYDNYEDNPSKGYSEEEHTL